MNRSHHLHPSLLREYDIRGIVGDTLNLADAEAVGRAFGSMIRRRGGHKVVIGRDGRFSSPALADAFSHGLMSVGCDVIALPIGPTPMQYFAIYELKADGGAMITGSHNPPEYNGIKLTMSDGPVFGEMIQKLGRMSETADFESGEGSYREHDIRSAYLARLIRDIDFDRPLKIAWDAGNGAAGEIMRQLTEKLPGEHILLFDEIDGNFPNHHPDPTIDEYMTILKDTVVREGCDLGIGFDGDGDRIGAVDHTGRLLMGDQLLAVYAEEVLAENPGAPVIADVKCSQTLFDEITRLGGEAIMGQTGHSIAKKRMAELNAPLAGEVSGHIFFGAPWYGFDDALYCAIRLISWVSRSDRSLKTMTDRLPTVFNTPEVRFQVDESRKFDIVNEVLGRVADLNAPWQIVDIDGIRLTGPDGWWLLRASNTQDVLIARAESTTREGLDRMRNMLIDQLKASGLTAPEDF